MISSFVNFLRNLCQSIGVSVNLDNFTCDKGDESLVAAKILNEINRFFYQTNSSLNGDYISEFHKYWEENHFQILNPEIDDKKCMCVANLLEEIYNKHDIRVQHDTLDLTNEQIANVRFFTAIQDFKIDIGTRQNPFQLYNTNPDFFNSHAIVSNELLIDGFLNALGASSQRDKRKKWMHSAAQLLNEKYNSNAFNINYVHGGDVQSIKNTIAGVDLYGFSQKKIDMLLRDMADLNVWKYKKNIQNINVMSDKNTMRVALRTGILKTRIPLLASYLDVYCYQYSLIDEWNALAWRRVWELWDQIDDNHRPVTPASIDYLIYRIGKLACWKASSRRRCIPNKPVTEKWLQAKARQDQLIFNVERYCVFNDICSGSNRILNHPMSISIFGQTGWKSGKSNEGGGGGIQS
ncbi:hypothetical protein DRO91_04530 [Candidatus Heimdallarchaeota archaeon]|nr:MAG: hypothetical protein DRO91_04530 [Candidatus Heimdallarchaeota archaeon]